MHFFTPNGKSLIFYEDRQLVFRNVQSGEVSYTIDFKRHRLEMFHLRFSPDGTKLLLLSDHVAPRLLDAVTGEELQVFEHSDLEWAIWGEFCPHGRSLFIGGPYNYVYRWDISSGKVVQTYHHDKWGFLRFAVSADSRYLVGGGGWSEAGVWDVESGEKLHTIPSKQESPYIGTILMLPDNQHALICEGTGGLIVNLASGDTRELDTNAERFVEDAIVAREANLLLTSAFQPTVAAKIWDVNTFESLATLVPHTLLPEKGPCYVDMTADGCYAATVLVTGSTLLLWDMGSRMVMRQHDWNDYFIHGG